MGDPMGPLAVPGVTVWGGAFAGTTEERVRPPRKPTPIVGAGIRDASTGCVAGCVPCSFAETRP